MFLSSEHSCAEKPHQIFNQIMVAHKCLIEAQQQCLEWSPLCGTVFLPAHILHAVCLLVCPFLYCNFPFMIQLNEPRNLTHFLTCFANGCCKLRQIEPPLFIFESSTHQLYVLVCLATYTPMTSPQTSNVQKNITILK